MTDTTITSANAVLTFLVAGLFPVPQTMKGFSSDAAFAFDAVDLAEVNMGVDGRMTAGFTPNPLKQTISLQADSPSKSFFIALTQAMKTAREVYYITGSLALPSTGESFSLVRGILTTPKQVPDGKKVLQAMDFVITWESVNPSVL